MSNNNKESQLIETLAENVASYADDKMTEELRIRTDYQIAKLVSELKDVIEYKSDFVPTEFYLKGHVFPPANLTH